MGQYVAIEPTISIFMLTDSLGSSAFNQHSPVTAFLLGGGRMQGISSFPKAQAVFLLT